jgi:putative acetyltransferase
MGEDRQAVIQDIRHFNRYYTNKVGLLSRHHFDTEFTLTEARVLLEIGRRGEHTLSGLRLDLNADMGYLSRVAKRLSALGLVALRRDPSDGRLLVLELTARGRKALQKVDAASDVRAEELVSSLSDEEARALVESLRSAERILEQRSSTPPLIERARSSADIATARVLMREYAAFLGADLSFQDFEKELASLPGKYAPPTGALFLAHVKTGTGGAEPAGCVALRKLSPGICEMKRLFVRPEYRGLQIGRVLAVRIVEEAKSLGYGKMRLDTLDRLESAVALYRSMGFRQIPPYCRNPLPGAMFWEKTLEADQ